MTNLNDCITMLIGWAFIKPYSISVELKLEAQDLPDLDESTLEDYGHIFHYLYGEVTDAKPRPTKVRITSKLEDKIQQVLIEHNGKPIPRETLERLNYELEGCAIGEARYKVRPHGTHIAGNLLRKYGGKMTLSNINDGDYHVQTKVEIPINPTHTLPIP